MTALRGMALASAAEHWLATTTSARVLNVFDRACNLINQDEAVLALVTSERGLTPFGLVVAGDQRLPFRGLPVDSPVRVEHPTRCLKLGPLVIDYARAEHWEARPDWPSVRQAFAADRARLGRLAAWAAQVELPGSLLDLYRPAQDGTALAQALLVMARQGALALITGLSVPDSARAQAGTRALAGLGGGLTPAGDDFIVGALLAAWAGLLGPGAVSLAPALAAAAAPRTTTLSAAYLQAAAHGECLAHWHALFAAQLCDDWPATSAALEALVSIGHTSGADALAGFLAVHYVLGTGA
jgi:hypothetical protein